MLDEKILAPEKLETFLDVRQQLKKHKPSMDHETWLSENMEHIDSIKKAFSVIDIYTKNLSDRIEQCIDIITQYPKYSNKLLAGMAHLIRADPNLVNQYMDLLTENQKHSHELGLALNTLYRNHLQSLYAEQATADPQTAYSLALGLAKLHNNDLNNKPYIDFLFEHPEQTRYFAECITMLKSLNILDDELISKLKEHIKHCKELANGIEDLKKAADELDFSLRCAEEW